MAKPTDNSEVFLDQLIASIQTHLPTIEGIYMTTSLYPPAMTPGPGIVKWIGYTIEPTSPSQSGGDESETPQTDEEMVAEEQAVEEASTLSPEQEEQANMATDAGLGISESTSAGLSYDPDAPMVFPSSNEDDSDESNSSVNDGESISGCSGSIITPSTTIINAMRKWGITTPLARAHFLAQCAHESGNFKYKKEIWGPSGAQQRYEGRRDLGNVVDGDGKRFMGRGYIQVTGRANYTQFNKGVSENVISNPTLVESKYVAETAAWFWKTRKLNNLAIDDTTASVRRITKVINGGYNGLDDRIKKFCGYWKKIKENPNLWT
jgi:putative chitinase